MRNRIKSGTGLLHGVEDEVEVAEGGVEAARVKPAAAREDGVPLNVALLLIALLLLLMCLLS